MGTSWNDDSVDAGVASYLAAIRSGQTPDRSVWLTRYPQWAAELAAFFADYDWARGWFATLAPLSQPLQSSRLGSRSTPSGPLPPTDRLMFSSEGTRGDA